MSCVVTLDFASFSFVAHMLPDPWRFSWLIWFLTHNSPQWQARAMLRTGQTYYNVHWIEVNLDYFFMVASAPRPRIYNSCRCPCKRGFVITLKDDRRYSNCELGYNLVPKAGLCISRLGVLNGRLRRSDDKEKSRGKEGTVSAVK